MHHGHSSCNYYLRGLKIVAKKRKFRLHAIADCISLEEYDIVALQEVWMREDFDYIKAKVASKLPFTKYFHRLETS